MSDCDRSSLSHQPDRWLHPTRHAYTTHGPTLPPANVACNNLTFYLDPSLGSGCECKTIPESSSPDIPMDIFIYPAYTELTIQDYPLTHTQFPPQIRIHPLPHFSQLLPDILTDRVSDLDVFIASGTWNGGELPFLPPLPMRQTFFGHETVLSFDGGQGVRFITDYNESNHPLNNRTIFYTLQGLSDDGMCWVAITLPISSPILPESVEFPPAAGRLYARKLVSEFQHLCERGKRRARCASARIILPHPQPVGSSRPKHHCQVVMIAYVSAGS